MNIQVGKSAGIALLMAAALLAALFAMGVFAPAGVDAGVKLGTDAPTVETVDSATADSDQLKINFTVTDTVDGLDAQGAGVNDNVVIIVPANATAADSLLQGTATGFGDGSVMVEQDGEAVGSASVMIGDGTTGQTVQADGLTITITKAGSDGTNLAADEQTTVTVSGLTFHAKPASGTVTIQQMPSSYVHTVNVAIFDGGDTPTNAKAYLMNNALVVEFAARRGFLTAYPVTITLPRTQFVGTIASTVDDGRPDDADTAADPSATPPTAEIWTTPAVTETQATETADGFVTVTNYEDGETIKVTITGLSRVLGFEGDQEVTIAEGTHYSRTLTVGGDAVTGPEGEDPDAPDDTADVLGKRNGAGATDVKITIDATIDATNGLGGGNDIQITLPGFGLPSSTDIDVRDVIIDGLGGTTAGDVEYYGHPASIGISGDTITLGLPTRYTVTVGTDDTTLTTLLRMGDYKITIKESAGISNPVSGGSKTIKVSDGDATDEELNVTIASSVSVEPKSGFVTKGGDATVTAKGLRDGLTTVYLLEMDDDDEYVRGEALGSGTADDGVVEIEIDTSGLAVGAKVDESDSDKDVGLNKLRVIDSNNAKVGMDVMLGIKPTVKLGSETAKRSASLEISVSDWYYGDINKVTIGGISVGDVDETVGSDMKETFKVTVPGDVRAGEQEVKVYGDDDELNTTSATAKVTIAVLPLDVSPSNVVPGHRVTITGSGFPNSTDVDEIMIGGKDITVPDDADSTSSGRVAVTVTVPLNVGTGDQAVTLKVGTRTGEGEITVPKPSIELDPSESVPGSVISVRGSGFAADGRVEVKFAGDIEEVGRADGSGDVHIRLTIPSDAGVGATNEVVVAVRDPDDTDDVEVNISAKADHKTPGPAITVPAQAQVGTLATISGTNFEPFTSLTVMIGGKDATPSGAETDKNGAFEVEARVPRLSAGSHTITVEDGSTDENSVTETFSVVLTPVVSTPEEVFGVLGDSLVSVWSLNNTTKKWSAYFPGAPEGVSDLTGVSRGDIVWINVNADVEFQGSMLTTGWNLISLE